MYRGRPFYAEYNEASFHFNFFIILDHMWLVLRSGLRVKCRHGSLLTMASIIY
jgi:hypothetical protein